MTDTPWLPLSKDQLARLVRAVDGTPGPRMPEKAILELVRLLRAEPGDDGASSRKRARRVGALGGLAGVFGQVPAEALHLVEEARAAVDIAPPTRADEELAADLLVVWNLAPDPGTAAAIIAGDQSLWETLYARSEGYVKDATPERWTPLGAIKFLWRMRVVLDARDAVPGGLVRNIPIVGAVPTALHASRDMKRFEKDLAAHYAALA